MTRLVLASASPRRRRVLEQLGLDFEVRPAPERVEGEWDGAEPPEAFVRRTAEAKATAVSGECPGSVVIAADTIVVLDDRVLGKPVDPEAARGMLLRLAGRGHVVETGVAVVAPGGAAVGVEETEVGFRALDEDEIAAYVATGESLDKAGAYGIQGYGAALVEGVHGCYFNVMGLPVTRLLEVLRRAGYAYEFPGRLRAVDA